MAAPVTVEELAMHLRIGPDERDAEAAMIAQYIDAATRYVETHTRLKLTGDDEVDPMAKQAVILLASHFYTYREPVITGAAAAELPLGLQRMLWLLDEGPEVPES